MSGIRRWLLTVELIDTPLLWILVALVVALSLVVALAPPRRPWRLLIALVVGGIGGFALAHVLEALGMFDGPLPAHAATWAAAGTGVAVAAVAAAFSRPLWRRLLAPVTAVLALVMGALGVNAAYGVTHDLAAILGVQTLDEAVLPAVVPADGDPATLYQRWTPPADMPARGTVAALSGDAAIPHDGFAARDAAVYLPPAALTADPPALPLIVFMMGQPGTPDPTSLAAALDGFAAAHEGLAPIALVVDQLGAPGIDPACHDSTAYGAVATYVNTQVPAFARARLNIVDDPAYWVVGGFSNGGACAFAWGAQHPEIWGNVMDVSGNEFPGSEHVDQTVAVVFGGDRAAFEAAKPAAVLAANPGAYDGHVAVFTRGDQDTTFGPGQVSNAQLARSAGFTVYEHAVEGAGHTGAALDGGLAFAIASLAPHLGLAPPSG